MKHKQNIQKAKVRKLKNELFLNSTEILAQIRGKMQLDSIRLEDLECLQELFEAKEKGAIPFHLVQIKKAFLEVVYTSKITSQQIHQDVYPFHFDNPKLTEYLESIWNEMFERQVQILIF